MIYSFSHHSRNNTVESIKLLADLNYMFPEWKFKTMNGGSNIKATCSRTPSGGSNHDLDRIVTFPHFLENLLPDRK